MTTRRCWSIVKIYNKKNRKKTEEVLASDFCLPEANTRAFLGLSSQLRDHVKGYATMAKPLHEATSDNKKNSKSPINWTPELEAQFKTTTR